MIRAPNPVDGSTPVGDSGLYVGGLDSAVSMVEQGMASPEQFKFFYNQCEWVPGALEQVRVPLLDSPFVRVRVVGGSGGRPLIHCSICFGVFFKVNYYKQATFGDCNISEPSIYITHTQKYTKILANLPPRTFNLHIYIHKH